MQIYTIPNYKYNVICFIIFVRVACRNIKFLNKPRFSECNEVWIPFHFLCCQCGYNTCIDVFFLIVCFSLNLIYLPLLYDHNLVKVKVDEVAEKQRCLRYQQGSTRWDTSFCPLICLAYRSFILFFMTENFYLYPKK